MFSVIKFMTKNCRRVGVYNIIFCCKFLTCIMFTFFCLRCHINSLLKICNARDKHALKSLSCSPNHSWHGFWSHVKTWLFLDLNLLEKLYGTWIQLNEAEQQKKSLSFVENFCTCYFFAKVTRRLLRDENERERNRDSIVVIFTECVCKIRL